jgi:cytochrome oxidase Cu insertion factor (SCO1/SenC/PrrC family)
MTTSPLPGQRSSRLKFLLVILVFAAPFIAAALLNFSGWQPSGKAYGQPIVPQRNFEQEHLQLRLADGKDWAWRDSSPRMTLIALAGPDCAAHCIDTLTKMAAARITLNNNMQRLRLLYVGQAPADAASDGMRNYWAVATDSDNRLAAYRPATPDSVSALLVESDGTALARYPVGFDPSGLRKDLQKVIR